MRAQGEFRSERGGFVAVRALAESFGAAAGARPELVQRLVLVLEELFTNTGTHGYGVASPGPVWVTLELGPGTVEVVYEDAAPPFDPFARQEGGPDVAPALDAPPGGFGIALVAGLATAGRYQRASGRNRVLLTFALPLSRSSAAP